MKTEFKPATLLISSLVLAGSLWLLAMLLLQQAEQNASRSRQLGQATQRITLLTQQLQQLLQNGQTATELLLSGDNDASGSGSFTRYAPYVLSANPAFDFLTVVQRVDQRQREAVELNQGLLLRQFEGNRLMPASVRPAYFPVAQQYPDDSEALPLHLDLGAQSDVGHALQHAIADGLPALVQLRTGSSQRLALFFSPKTRPLPLLLGIGLNPAQLLTTSSQGAASEQLRLRILIQDRQHPLLADSHPNLPPESLPLLRASRIIGGQQLTFEVMPVGDDDSTGHGLLLAGVLLLAAIVLMGSAGSRLSRQNRQKLQYQSGMINRLQDSNVTLKTQQERQRERIKPLQDTEERHRALLAQQSDGLILLNDHGQVILVNPAAARLIGQQQDALLQLPAGALISELHHPPHSSFAEHVAPLIGHPFEALLICDQSFMLQVEMSISLIMPDHTAPFYLVMCRNIAARKEREAALLRLTDTLAEQVETRSRQLSALLDASPMAMAYIVDRHFKQVNKAFLTLFQRREDEIIEHSTRILYDSDEQFLRTGRIAYPALNNGEISQDDMLLARGGGDNIWVRMFGRAVKPGQPALGSVWLYQDISAQRTTEEALRRARDLAEETSRAKTEFLANMSHELRTPLHAILGFAEMGQQQEDPAALSRLHRYFERIHHSGSRLLSLLNELLDLSKMEVGRMEYAMQRSDLQHVIRECLDELRGQAEQQGISLLFVPLPNEVLVDMDAFRIGQVVRNLLSNAIKFSPQGARVSVDIVPGSSPEAPLRVDVRDYGPGVPEHEREQIFDKFIQSSLTKTGAGGTGLGLAICREIVHAHGGAIAVHNAEGGGAIFSFTLPRRQYGLNKEK
ncbi:ATP-binding protein [Vogesella sp. LIG4]|uniref:ATP-binding protein n=1 Tax=Vogesella sp. LIG4 TaxID=1192162 RepID=UPI0008201D81|nr:ATP-binding protein [Vogesella sp. LIG4]SCK17261.1 PAS domain S-box-containing protein [Vogesella sp. LIG4]